MDEIKWFDLVPSAMSAVASVGAAIAAFGSLRVSREAKSIAEQSALAIHHTDAAVALSKAVEKLISSTNVFAELAYDTWAKWPSEIETLDQREAGGSNPRPLRHVITDASEMLVTHETTQKKQYAHIARSMYSIVLDGIHDLNDAEYEKLLKRADGEYSDFEGVFGATSASKRISSAPAFRWACYQLNRRVDKTKWREIWQNSWHENGWLNKFRSEQTKIRSTLETIRASLKSEKTKLEHSVFPLESNASLYMKYSNVLETVEVLLEDCSLERVEWHAENAHIDDVIQLLIYSMGIAFLATDMLARIDRWQDS
ncbi:MAG TPA: hypothetical protein VIU93_04395 [Gallionellaceae bacterium]